PAPRRRRGRNDRRGGRAVRRRLGGARCLAAAARQERDERERPEAVHRHDVLRDCARRTSGARSARKPRPRHNEDNPRDLDRYDGQEVTLRGWLYNKRSSKKVHFLEVRDGTGILQCVAGVNDVPAELFARTDKLPQETALVVTGKVRRDSRSPLGFEL